MNSVSITGRITKDVELRSTQNGTMVSSFTVAVDRPAVKDKTDFIDCVAWRNTAEFVSKYFHKGDGIEIVGVLTTRNYETSDGQKRKATEVAVEHISFPKSKKSSGDQQNNPEPQPEGNFEELPNDEDLPF